MPTLTPVLIPHLTSTLVLFYAIIEPTIFIPFIRSSRPTTLPSPTTPKSTSLALYHFWNHFYFFSLTTIMAILLPTILSSGYLLATTPLSVEQYKLLATGCALSILHLAFAPWIVPKIDAMCDEKVMREGRTVDVLRRWLRVHYFRTLVADLPAWACFALAVYRT